MADKEATVYIIDLGRSMGRKQNDRKVSDLDWSLKWLEDKLTNIVYLARKTLVVGVLGLGTDDTKNSMADDGGYEHISVLQNMQPMSMQDLRTLSPQFTPSTTDDRDALSAIILAVDMLMRHCKQLKWKKQIVLVTNATGAMDPSEDDITSTAEQIKQTGIELLILGVDFDDAEYGFKEEDKSSTKASNEKSLKALADQCNGKIATMAEAIEGLSIPYIKPVRPTPTYRGNLCLGDPTNYDTAIMMEVERYFKVAVRRPPTASSYMIKGDPTEQGNVQTVEISRSYQVPNPSQPGGMLAVERDELAKGYEYGRTAVHIAESDENITKLETDSSYDILGFIPKDRIERYMILENTNMIVAQKGNAKAALALSSLIHALYEIDSVALARLVKKDMSEPMLMLLSPLIQEDIECLIENNLPFAEDLRQYRFPPIDKVVTVSGKKASTYRTLPTKDLTDAMSDFVDSLNLVDDQEEKLMIEETYSPVNYSVESAIKYRAIHPGADVPPIPDGLLASSKQPIELQERSHKALERLIKVAEVKKVPPKVKGRRKYRETEKPLSGLNIDALFQKESRTKISPDNAIPEFKQALNRAQNENDVEDVMKQMVVILENKIKNAYGDKYDQVIEALGQMRQEITEMEEPHFYNDIITDLKRKILDGKLGGNRKMLWYQIKVHRLGLIDEHQSEESKITRAEADEFSKST